MTQIIDIVEDTYKQSRDLSDRWSEFFYKFQKSKNVNGQLEFERPYITQIKGMSAASPHIYEKMSHNKKKDVELGRRIFQIDYNDLVEAQADFMQSYDEDNAEKREIDIKVLCYQIRNDWESAEKDIKNAVYSLMQTYNKNYADILTSDSLEVELENFEITKSITGINSEDLDKFVRVKGTVAQYDDQSSLDIIETGWRCDNCDNLASTKARKPPKKCANCGEVSFTEVRDNRKVIDFMYFVIQDLYAQDREGRQLPPPLNVSVNGRNMVQSVYQVVESGLNVAVNGVIKIQDLSAKSGNTIVGWELECHGIEFTDESSVYDEDLKAEAEKEIPEDQKQEHFTRIIRSIAPHLQGLDNHKEVLWLALTGASAWKSSTGTRMRSELNVAFLGDSSAGKSELCKAAKQLSPGSTYVQGQLASKVGLTASITSNEILRGGVLISKSTLNPGVYGFTRSGKLVILDEIDKVSSTEHLEAIASATDDFQVMSIHKNVAHTEIPVYCGSIFAGNPQTNGGKYDMSRDVFSQFNWATWLWSRIDLPMLHVRKHSDESRMQMWNARRSMEQDSQLVEGQEKRKRTKTYKFGEEELYTYDYLIHEIAYLRSHYHPKLDENSLAYSMLMRFWNWWNNRNIMPPDQQNKKIFIPVLDERKINSIKRVAIAIARSYRKNVVDTNDMGEALRLFKESIQMFTPRVDNDEIELNAIAATTVMIDAGLKAGIKIANKETQQKIHNFMLGLNKCIKLLHREYFNACNQCHGKGYLESPEFICYGCNGSKGAYQVITYKDWEYNICGKVGLEHRAEEYFGLLKRAKFIAQDSEKAYDIKASHAGTWRIIIDLHSKAVNQINAIINEYFELQSEHVRPPSIGTAYEEVKHDNT